MNRIKPARVGDLITVHDYCMQASAEGLVNIFSVTGNHSSSTTRYLFKDHPGEAQWENFAKSASGFSKTLRVYMEHNYRASFTPF